MRFLIYIVSLLSALCLWSAPTLAESHHSCPEHLSGSQKEYCELPEITKYAQLMESFEYDRAYLVLASLNSEFADNMFRHVLNIKRVQLEDAIKNGDAFASRLFIESSHWGFGTRKDRVKSKFWWKVYCNEYPRDYQTCDPSDAGYFWRLSEEEENKVENIYDEWGTYLWAGKHLNIHKLIEPFIP